MARQDPKDKAARRKASMYGAAEAYNQWFQGERSSKSSITREVAKGSAYHGLRMNDGEIEIPGIAIEGASVTKKKKRGGQ